MSNSGKKATDDDDVEQLLRAAQEDVLLKLSVNSHMARGSGAVIIDSDLDRRFQALKKPQKLTKRDDPAKIPSKKEDAAAGAPADDVDLDARFAALKNSLPSNSSSFPVDRSIDQQAIDELEEEEDEVEKVIKWAIDAARLDPSPLSDDDDDDDDDEHRSNDESDYSSDDGVDDRGKKSKRK